MADDSTTPPMAPQPQLWRGLVPPETPPPPGIGRRDFLKLVGAGASLALSACSGPGEEKVLPYVDAPPGVAPSRPLFYASVLPCEGFGVGVLVESQMGRPVKIEGNRLHPASLGATDAALQAAVLDLYDADRSRTPLQRGAPRSLSAFFSALAGQRNSIEAAKGAGVALVTGNITSPTLAAQLETLRARWPGMRWFRHQPVARDDALRATQIAFGRPLGFHYRLDRARAVIALDADLFGHGPASIRYARDFSRNRRPEQLPSMAQLLVAEATPTITGATADVRLPVRACEIGVLLGAIAARLGLLPHAAETPHAQFADRAAALLRAAQGHALIAVGERQSAEVQALAHALNSLLDHNGRTVVYTEPVDYGPYADGDAVALAHTLAAGDVRTLIFLDVNPLYDAPASLGLEQLAVRVPFKVHAGLYQDETAAVCDWHVPLHHPLESFGDLRAFDGTAALLQPVIEPLYAGLAPTEFIAALLGQFSAQARTLVHDHWLAQHGNDFEDFYVRALADGVVPDSAAPTLRAPLRAGALVPPPAAPSGIELNFAPDPRVGDGRQANNAWLQELPKPITKLVWDNALLIAPADADALGVATGDLVRAALHGATLECAVWVEPGHAPAAATLHLGYGRRSGGHHLAGCGFDAYQLRPAPATAFSVGLTIEKLGRRYNLVSAQHHNSMEGRDLLRTATLAAYRAAPDKVAGPSAPLEDETLYNRFPYDHYKWAMVIDLTACTGCGACVAACQAENNIAVVGKPQVALGREMHWLRIDRYYAGPPAAPAILFQPVPCMQCEHAPCEVVCPVEASVHDDEGINVQVYNRCVGTRFCSNNCPYKVRRFNFLEYANAEPPVTAVYNPEVTVRMRGVMEKCNYCLQRISRGRIAAQLRGSRLRDGEVVTACAAVCPTEAIVFGDLNDPDSAVGRLKKSQRNYQLLGELNTRPRTSYLVRISNPPPEA